MTEVLAHNECTKKCKPHIGDLQTYEVRTGADLVAQETVAMIHQKNNIEAMVLSDRQNNWVIHHLHRVQC